MLHCLCVCAHCCRVREQCCWERADPPASPLPAVTTCSRWVVRHACMMSGVADRCSLSLCVCAHTHACILHLTRVYTCPWSDPPPLPPTLSRTAAADRGLGRGQVQHPQPLHAQRVLPRVQVHHRRGVRHAEHPGAPLLLPREGHMHVCKQQHVRACARLNCTLHAHACKPARTPFPPQVDGKTIKAQIWDTVGVRRFTVCSTCTGCMEGKRPPRFAHPVSRRQRDPQYTGRPGALPRHHQRLLPGRCGRATGVRHHQRW